MQDFTASAQRFSLRYAHAMLAALALSLCLQRILPIALITLALLISWLWELRSSFVPLSRFGAANAVTSVRALVLVCLSASIDAGGGIWAAAWTLSIFALDGLDGWLARKAGTTSDFGARYDAETDAALMLVLAAGVYQLELAGVWVLCAGALRFVYVIAMHRWKLLEAETPRTPLGRYVFSVAITSLTACFWPAQRFSQPLAALATGVLVYSFWVQFSAARRASAAADPH